MRISFNEFYQGTLTRILTIQDSLNEKQNQAASGNKISKISDDPQASGRIINLERQIVQLNAFQVNVDAVKRHLNEEELAIKGYTNALNRIRELTVGIGNTGVLSTDDQNALLQEIRLIKEQIIDISNTQNATGEFIFAGYQVQNRPFNADTAGRIEFSGDQGQRILQVGTDTEIPINDSGQDIFMDIPAVADSFETTVNTGNTGTGIISRGRLTDLATWQAGSSETYNIIFNPLAPGMNFDVEAASNPGVPLPGFDDVPFVAGQEFEIEGITVSISGSPQPGDEFTIQPANNLDVFAMIDNLIDGVGSTDPDVQAFGISSALDNLDAALQRGVDIRAEIGARINVSEVSESFNEDIIFYGRESIGQDKDVDYAEVITDIEQLAFALEVAQSTFTRVQGLSIFNFLR